jgi:hypothetical protein
MASGTFAGTPSQPSMESLRRVGTRGVKRVGQAGGGSVLCSQRSRLMRFVHKRAARIASSRVCWQRERWDKVGTREARRAATSAGESGQSRRVRACTEGQRGLTQRHTLADQLGCRRPEKAKQLRNRLRLAFSSQFHNIYYVSPTHFQPVN